MEDPIVGWESTLASLAWLPPKYLKQFKANFSWFMANVDVTIPSPRTTSESTDLGESEIESAIKTPPRKRSKTGDRSATRTRDHDWEAATPVKRSARKPKPKVGWSESATKKKREPPVFNPEQHVWNKMKVRPRFPLIVSHFGLPIQMSSARNVFNASEPRNGPASPSNQAQRDALDAYLTTQGATLVRAKRLAVWRLLAPRKLAGQQKHQLSRRPLWFTQALPPWTLPLRAHLTLLQPSRRTRLVLPWQSPATLLFGPQDLSHHWRRRLPPLCSFQDYLASGGNF